MPKILNNNIQLLDKGQKVKEVLINELAKSLSVLKGVVISRAIATPPTNPSVDSFYIVPSNGSGVWSGNTNKIVYPATDNAGTVISGSWKYLTPYSGLIIYCLDESGNLLFNGTSWQFQAILDVSVLMQKSTYDTDNDGVVDNSELLQGQNGAYYLSRANHTGTQPHTTISGLSTVANTGSYNDLTNKPSTEELSGLIPTASNLTYTLTLAASFACTISNLKIISSSGTCTAAIKINATSVTGISAVSVSSTLATATASGSNSVAVNDKISLEITNNSSAKDVAFTLKLERT